MLIKKKKTVDLYYDLSDGGGDITRILSRIRSRENDPARRDNAG